MDIKPTLEDTTKLYEANKKNKDLESSVERRRFTVSYLSLEILSSWGIQRRDGQLSRRIIDMEKTRNATIERLSSSSCAKRHSLRRS